MLYLMMHSTYFVSFYQVSDVVRDHADSKRGNPLPPFYGLHFLIGSKMFVINHPTDRKYIPWP